MRELPNQFSKPIFHWTWLKWSMRQGMFLFFGYVSLPSDGPWTGPPRDRISICGKGKTCFSYLQRPDWHWFLPRFLCDGFSGTFPLKQRRKGVELIIHLSLSLSLMPGLWIRERTSSLPDAYLELVCHDLRTGTTLTLPSYLLHGRRPQTEIRVWKQWHFSQNFLDWKSGIKQSRIALFPPPPHHMPKLNYDSVGRLRGVNTMLFALQTAIKRLGCLGSSSALYSQVTIWSLDWQINCRSCGFRHIFLSLQPNARKISQIKRQLMPSIHSPIQSPTLLLLFLWLYCPLLDLRHFQVLNPIHSR
jgi:hypothetical protein